MQLSPDHSHHFELLRILGHAYYGGSDVQEVLQVASALIPGDDESWFSEWDSLARRVRAYGDQSMSRGHRRSAAQCYLRASMYFMISDFYLHGNVDDPRIVASGRASRLCFMAASADLDYAVERAEIPYEGRALPAYILKRKCEKAEPARTLLCQSGFDGTKEEAALWPGMAAMHRGYTVILFEGPGQGEMIRENKLPFRPDWQTVVTPVVDYALTRADVDASRIALMGISMGGLLAPIAATKEHRLRALIANGGVVSLGEVVGAKIPAVLLADKKALNTAIAELIANDTTMRWGTSHGKYVFGTADFAQYVAKAETFKIKNLEDIRCDTLVIDAEQEGFFAGQPKRMFDALTCKKTFMNFSNAESAGAHCQAGAESIGAQKIFDWLDETLG